MKKSLCSLSIVVISLAAQGQGIVQLNNRVPIDGVDAPVWIYGRPPTTASYPTLTEVVAAYGGWNVGIISADSRQLLGATTTFRTDNLSRIGYFNAIDVDIGSGPKNILVAAWVGEASTRGYAAAAALGNMFGQSTVFTVTGGVAPNVPSALVGLHSFQANLPIPEPSVFALFALGGLFLAAKRRRVEV